MVLYRGHLPVIASNVWVKPEIVNPDIPLHLLNAHTHKHLEQTQLLERKKRIMQQVKLMLQV